MANKFLDDAGLKVLWDLINQTFESKADLIEVLNNYATNDDVDDKIEEALSGLGDALHYLGIVESTDAVESPVAGDVVIVGNQEYIYNGDTWQLFGDEDSIVSIDALTETEIKNICK